MLPYKGEGGKREGTRKPRKYFRLQWERSGEANSCISSRKEAGSSAEDQVLPARAMPEL